jgi:hypothetical protein
MYERRWTDFTNGPFAQRIVATGAALTLLLTVLAPESSAPLTFWSRLLFWGLHIGAGLAAACLAAKMLVQNFPALRDWRLVILSGLAGVLLFAPIAYGLEALFPLAQGAPDSDWADVLAQKNIVAAIIVEAMEMAPSYLAAWAVINLGSFSDVLASFSTASEEAPESPAAKYEEAPVSTAAPANAFFERLPPAIGKDVIAVSSDLHYLRVVTREGQAMVLGALKEVEDFFGDSGLRVHRSHWVNLEAVVRLVKPGSGWQLEMSNGSKIPVSRRKRTEVIEYLGEDFVRSTTAA